VRRGRGGAGRLATGRRVAPTASPTAPAVRLQFASPEGAVLGAADEPLDAAVSPTSDEVVFAATANGVSQLWRRALSSDRATPIPGTEAASFVAWIPGERGVSFVAGGTLKQINLDTGVAATLQPSATPPAPPRRALP